MGVLRFIGGSIFLLIIFSGAWKVILFILLAFLNAIYIKIISIPWLMLLLKIGAGIVFFLAIIAIIAKVSSFFEKKPTHTPIDDYTYRRDPFINTDCSKGGKHSSVYYEHFGAQKRKCSKCGTIDSEYYIPNYYE